MSIQPIFLGVPEWRVLCGVNIWNYSPITKLKKKRLKVFQLNFKSKGKLGTFLKSETVCTPDIFLLHTFIAQFTSKDLVDLKINNLNKSCYY